MPAENARTKEPRFGDTVPESLPDRSVQLQRVAAQFLSYNNLGADAGVGENFQQDGMIHSTIHKRNFGDATLNGGDCAVHFGNHSFVHDAGFFEFGNFADLQMRNDCFRISWIAHQSRDIAHEYKARGFESNRGLRGGNVGIAIIDLAGGIARGWTDHWSNAALNAVEQRLGFYGDHFADKTNIELLAFVREQQFAAGENIAAG